MAVALKEISGWLDQLELKYDLGDDKIVFFSGDESAESMHVVKAREEGSIFEWSMGIVSDEKDGIFKVREHKHLSTLLVYLLQINYQTKFGTWEYDPQDGEIALKVEIPLEDAKMTFKQFKRICSLTMDTGKYTENIKKILETGEMPENAQDELMQLALKVFREMEQKIEAISDEDGI